MAEGDKWKATFRTNCGSLKPLVMFFRLCNSLGTFQNMINDVLRQWIDNRVAIVYLDGILNFTKTQSKYIAGVCRVLQMLWENKLFLKPEKCEFFKDRIEYLRLIISHSHTEMDPIKVNRVRDWPCPCNVKEVQLFLGFVNFYHCFVQDFAKITCPLNNLTQKDMAF